MKKMFFIAALMMCFITVSFGQDSIKITPDKATVAFMQSPVDDITTYNRAISWVNHTYVHPEKVLGAAIEGESLLISGFADDAWYYKNLGMEIYYDLAYKIQIDIKDSVVIFNFIEGTHYIASSSDIFLGSSKSFFKNNGEYRTYYNTAKSSLESTINNLWFSFYKKINDNSLSSEEALTELKKLKDKLDLGLITQEDYDKKKEELSKFIK